MNSEIAFAPTLRERVALLAGLNASVIDSIIENRLTLASGGLTLVATMRAHDSYIALVSNGLDVFASHLAAKRGFDENRENHLI